jgi:hypothetical protein
MYTWTNIPPHHEISCAMCQQNIPKKFDPTHVLMFMFSCSPNSNPPIHIDNNSPFWDRWMIICYFAQVGEEGMWWLAKFAIKNEVLPIY